MTQEYYSIITNAGLIKNAAANSQGGTLVNLTHLAVGDANNTPYNPTGTDTALQNELYRTTLTSVVIDEDNPNQLIVEAVINETIGPFYIREVGIFDSDGELFAIGKYPETFKPDLPDGSGKRLYIRMILGFANSPNVELVISDDINNDPNFSTNVNNALAERLVKTENLADLESAEEARGNLGLGSVATKNAGNSEGEVPLVETGGKLNPSILPVFPSLNLPYAVNKAYTVSGYASYINKVNDSEISFNVSTSYPIVVTHPDGTKQSLESLGNISGISSNGLYYIILTKDSDSAEVLGVNRLITESTTAPSSPTDGDYWLDISQQPYVPYKRVGGAWVQTQFVRLGEVNKVSGVLGTPISYALNWRYSKSAGILNPNTRYNFPTNIPTPNIYPVIYLQNVVAEFGWTPGQISFALNGGGSPDTYFPHFFWEQRNVFTISVNDVIFASHNNVPNADVGFTTSRWEWFIEIRRNF